MTAWYNENDAYAAGWLRNLINERFIADGEVIPIQLEVSHER